MLATRSCRPMMIEAFWVSLSRDRFDRCVLVKDHVFATNRRLISFVPPKSYHSHRRKTALNQSIVSTHIYLCCRLKAVDH